jgi:hypothetical protein
VRIKNTDDAVKKIHDDLKAFFYSVKMKEREAFLALDRMGKLREELVKKIKESYGITEEDDYDFEAPETPGRPGILKRKK